VSKKYWTGYLHSGKISTSFSNNFADRNSFAEEFVCMIRFKRTIYPLVLPFLLIILSSVLIWHWHELLVLVDDANKVNAFLIVLPIFPNIFLYVGILMGWRYNNAGLMLASIVLVLSYAALSMDANNYLAAENMDYAFSHAAAFLLPLNLASFAMMTKRRIFNTAGMAWLVFLMYQSFAVLLFCYPQGEMTTKFIAMIDYYLPWLAKNISDFSLWLSSVVSYQSFINIKNMATASIISFALALVFVLGNFIYTRDIRIGGFFLALVALFLGFGARDFEPAVNFYFMVAALTLIFTAIEASFSMAYIDELTGLQGRRSLNETLYNLGRKYVDHFKKFNDTYGHKTGDQVLKMIANKLESISGGAKTFRYGGEEFTAIFPGKDAEESFTHLDELRRNIQSTQFVIRSKGSRKGQENRRGQGKSADQKQVTVTVSIGIASPERELTDPEKVLKAADKSLYKAKKNGRNRVER
jgi:GGDEF domain-containing protein